MFGKEANFTAARAFQFASTHLVLELGIMLAVLMGWQFTLAEFTGGTLMIVIMVLLFNAFLTPRIVAAARQPAEKGLQGRIEGHAFMDMSVHEGSRFVNPKLDSGLQIGIVAVRSGLTVDTIRFYEKPSSMPPRRDHFPMQNVEKIKFRISSDVVCPVSESRAQSPR
jgi:hypothetical protein